ncbi:unnamed protein product [Adineta ricciae]|uniref:Uncharacterized protein n=1 Tax=Adineta ricciae TaxID=249248 RepID=A0A814K243_ADIRI|nr:unnamed protein product [Adineta ricciae]CAF1502666.1 unnamed protein product [Adineta ricciae]
MPRTSTVKSIYKKYDGIVHNKKHSINNRKFLFASQKSNDQNRAFHSTKLNELIVNERTEEIDQKYSIKSKCIKYMNINAVVGMNVSSIESHDYVPMGDTQEQKQEALTQIQKQDVLPADKSKKSGAEQHSTNENFSKLIEELRFTNANICKLIESITTSMANRESQNQYLLLLHKQKSNATKDEKSADSSPDGADMFINNPGPQIRC